MDKKFLFNWTNWSLMQLVYSKCNTTKIRNNTNTIFFFYFFIFFTKIQYEINDINYSNSLRKKYQIHQFR